MESSLPTLGGWAPFAVAPEQDFASRLAKEMQQTRYQLETRALAAESLSDPKEIAGLKKTLNGLYCNTLQKKAVLSRLSSTLASEMQANSQPTIDLTGDMERRIRELTARLVALGRRQEIETARSESYESMKAKDIEGLVSPIQRIAKERLAEVESLQRRLMRKYEAVRQTEFKANTHLSAVAGHLRREVRTSQSTRKRQIEYTEQIESARVQQQGTIERGIESLSRTTLQRQDRHYHSLSQLHQLQADFQQIQQNRADVRKRKELLTAFETQFRTVERLIEGKELKGDLACRVATAFRNLGNQQLSLSTRFHELSTEHDVKKHQCEEIRSELETLKNSALLPAPKSTGSANLLRAALEDGQAHHQLDISAHKVENLAFGLYLRINNFVGTILAKAFAVCADSAFSTRLKTAISELTEIKAPEFLRDSAAETALNKRTAKTFSTEVDMPIRAQFAYALSIDDIRRCILFSHPKEGSQAGSLAELLRDIPAVAFFLTLEEMERHFRTVKSGDLFDSCPTLIATGFGVLNTRVQRLAEALPLFASIQTMVDSTDMRGLTKPPQPFQDFARSKVRKITVADTCEAPHFASEDISLKAENDDDEAEYLQLTRRIAKEAPRPSAPLIPSRSASQPIRNYQRSKKQGMVLRIAQLEEKLKALRESEKSALDHLRKRNSVRAPRWEGSQGSFRTLSSTGSFDSRPGTSLPQARPSLPRPKTSQVL